MGSVAKTTKTYTYRSTGGGNADVQIEYSADLSALSRLEDKIRLLQEDLETEREFRQRIEREKADLSVQVIQLSERLEEAEGGAESQFEINKKRDTELGKLRKLLEDVHLESEETAHLLRKKHQEIVTDFQDQIDQLSKSKQRVEKEKAKFQQEVYELLAQVESATKEKIISVKQVEKLETVVHELNIRIEELNRTIIDITSHKTRLSQENIELVKEVQDLKVNIENATYLKSQLAGQLEDARRRLEDDERRRSLLEASLHQVEVELESVRVQLEEEAEARLDLERQLVRANGEASTWKSKYETEASARAEEVEELRRKYTVRIQEQEEHIESIVVKLNNLEKQKSRLQSEVEILIIDLEKANNTARELQKRSEHLEKINIELKSRLDETTNLYESSQRDLRNKQTEIQRLTHELDKTREQKDSLSRENKKLSDDLHDARNQLADLNRRLHELEIECRRLENEREELTAAYKEAEAGRKAEEQRAQRLTQELGQYRHDAERRLQEKDDEIDSIRKQTSIEIEQLNARVVEAETKLKTEVTRIKKKLQIQITELELSLDVANKNNIELQKTCKKQSLQLTEIQAHYDELQRQLAVTMDQFGISQRRVQSLTAELEEIRGNLDAALRSKRNAEQSYEEAVSRVNELTTINVNLASAKSKLEQELSQLANDYDEVTKELRVSDERYQRVQVELKHTVEILHEEQERIVKIEAIKKSLEIEVKNLSVRLEEVEANAIVGGKRVISKLEARIRDIELELDEEKRRHAETIKILRKKERQVKEVLIQSEEDQKNVILLQENVDKLTQKINLYKRQLQETEGMSQQSVTRVRRFQRELEAAEDRADTAESNLSLIRAKHRTFVTTSTVPGSQVLEKIPVLTKICFICDTSITGKYYDLANYKLKFSKKEVIEKLGALVGDKCVVICQSGDVICQRCVTVLETLDRLENETTQAKRLLLRFLDKKYTLANDEDDFLIQSETDGIQENKPAEEKISLFTARKRKAQEAVEKLTQEVYDDPRSRIWLKCDTCQYTTNYTAFVQRHIRKSVCAHCDAPLSDGLCSLNCGKQRIIAPSPKVADVPVNEAALSGELPNNFLEENSSIMETSGEDETPISRQINLDEDDGSSDKRPFYLQIFNGAKDEGGVREMFTVANSSGIEGMSVMWDEDSDRPPVLLQGSTSSVEED